jgi:fluoroquinolone transport system ATP-binding protein
MIHVQDLTYVYPGADGPAVSCVSFTVARGEIFGLLGPSGAGKSTIQRVLTRQNRRFRGVARVLDQALDSWDHTFYEHIGVGFEMPNHYPRLTGRENLEFFASLYSGPTRSAVELLELVGLGDAADERVGEYSKGMQTRLSFLRTLQHDPTVLFLDEPTAGLDPVNAAVIKELILEERAGGTTVLLTTHNMADVDELCDRVGFLVEGRMSVVDPPHELKARYGKRTVRVQYLTEAGATDTAEYSLDGLAHDREFLELLDSRPIRSLHSQEANLNQVFADVTGAQLAPYES